MIKDLIRHLTFVTIHSSPSRFASETCSILYVTRAIFTVCGTRSVTVTAVDTSIITSCIKSNKYSQHSIPDRYQGIILSFETGINTYSKLDLRFNTPNPN